MNAFERLNSWLEMLEKRLRWAAWARGAAITVAFALVATLLLVFISSRFAFSESSLVVSRFLLFLVVALALALGVVWPLLGLSRRRAAGRAERRFPEFEQRLVTLVERQGDVNDPFLELLADDAAQIAERATPGEVVPSKVPLALASVAAAALGTLVWMIMAGPGFLGYGAALLWGGVAPGAAESFFRIQVTPGSAKVRRGSDLLVNAHLIGFQAQPVRLFARYNSASRWEEARMQAQLEGGSGYQFLFAGLAEGVQYYITAGPVRTEVYKLQVINLPGVKKIRVTYHYPKWMGLAASVEDPGGDLRAIEGTEAAVEVETDKPLPHGVLVLDDRTRIPLAAGSAAANRYSATVKIEKDGVYHVASLEDNEAVRISQDYFIEAQKEHEPLVRIRRPGRDAKVSPIEEVTIEADAEDDFALNNLELHYSVNAGEEKTVPLATTHGKSASGSATLYLEDFKLVPGDVVSYYAVAHDARHTARTDIYFLEAQPYEFEYSQAQQMGGMQGGGQGDRQDEISKRQKEIIAATWNQLRDQQKKPAQQAEDGKFLSGVQSKLSDQAQSLAARMKSRELAQTNQEFQSFASDMAAASKAMDEAAARLKALDWKQALPPEQQALQHILRAEATRRQIQVAFGRQGGGGGGAGGGRDLDNLFDLELDTEKNQYETGQSAASAEQRSRDIDEALQKLEQLARRQEELAQRQQRNPAQSFEQRWQQEMLRREAEQLQRQMEQLSRDGSSQQSSSQQQASSSSQGGQQSQQGQQGRQQSRQAGSQQQGQAQGQQRAGVDPRLDRALEQLRRATEDMRDSASQPNQQDGQGNANSRRASERLNEALNTLNGLRRQEAGAQMDDLARRSARMAEQQKDLERRMQQEYANQPPGRLQPGQSRQKAAQLAAENENMAGDLARLEQDMQRASRELAGTQRQSSSKLRDAVGDLQKDQIELSMRVLGEWTRRGLGSYAWTREKTVTQGLDKLRDQVNEARAAMGETPNNDQKMEQALNQVERLRSRMEEMTRLGRPGERGQQGQGQNGQQQGQPGQQQGQPGQQPGQAGQQQGQSGQQQGQNQGGQRGGGQPGQAAGGRGGDYNGGDRQQAGGVGDHWRDSWNAMNRGDLRPPSGNGVTRPPDPREMERAYRQGLSDLNSIRRTLRSEIPETASNIDDLIHEMQRLDPSRFPGNPALVERLRTEVLPGLEQVEIQLRRKVEDQQSGVVRSGADETPPAGYAEAVADYFRRLSKGKP